MVRQLRGFFGSFDAPCSERSFIHLFSTEKQNPFSDSFGFKNLILDFLKETNPLNLLIDINTELNFMMTEELFLQISHWTLHFSIVLFSWCKIFYIKKFLRFVTVHVSFLKALKSRKPLCLRWFSSAMFLWNWMPFWVLSVAKIAKIKFCETWLCHFRKIKYPLNKVIEKNWEVD